MKIQFDNFELDPELVELKQHGRVLKVQPKLFRLLCHLIEHRSRAVSKDELLGLLWQDETVVPGVLTTAIHSLRQLLGDDPRKPRFVLTVHRTGYRFLAPVALSGAIDAAESSPRSPSDGSEVSESRHRGFIGRERELDAWRHSIAEPRSAARMLFVHGAPGIGKTCFLHELAWDAAARGLTVARLFGDYLAPIPQALSEAFAQALGPKERTGEELHLILVDNWEKIAALDEWLRDSWLPGLSAGVRLVLASRQAPSVRWRTDPAWQKAIVPIELGPFSESECFRFLEARSIGAERGSALFRRTRGHPLALALLADSAESNAGLVDVAQRPELVESLVSRFVGALDDVSKRDALVVASLVPAADEPLLAATIASNRAHELMSWLLGLSFVRPTPRGASVHALASDAIVAQMRARNVNRLLELLGSTSAELLRRLKDDRDDKLVIARSIHSLVRHHPMLRPLYIDEAAELRTGLATARMCQEVPALVERRQGPECGRLARRWLELQPDHVWLVRRPTDELVGFLQLVVLKAGDREACGWDPVVARMFQHLDGAQLLEPDDMIMIHRHCVSLDTDDAFSPSGHALSEAMTCDHLWYPEKLGRLAHAYTVESNPESWEPIARFGGFELQRDYITTIGHHRFGLFHHSFRERPVERWVADIMARVIDATS